MSRNEDYEHFKSSALMHIFVHKAVSSCLISSSATRVGPEQVKSVMNTFSFRNLLHR